MRFSPGSLIVIGILLMILGIVLPLLMVIHVLTSTFFLNFFSYTVSLVGMIVGFYGVVSYVRAKPRKNL